MKWPAWLPRDAAVESVVAAAVVQADASVAAVRAASSSGLPVIPGEATSSAWAQQQYRVIAAPRVNRPSGPLLVGIGIFGLVAAIVTFTVLSQTGALNGSSSARPLASPTPAGSEYQQADRFLTGLFSTSINQVAELQKSMVASCNGSVVVSAACKDSIVSNDNALLGAIAVIDKGPVPACIAPAVKTLRTDLAGMEQGLATARVAQTQPGVGAGLVAYALAAQALPADGAALQTAENAICAKDAAPG